MKKLRRSNNAMLLGVCAGLAEFFDLDVTLIRIIWVVISIIGIGSPILLYLIMAIIMPKAENNGHIRKNYDL